jgi:hypothetical protein
VRKPTSRKANLIEYAPTSLPKESVFHLIDRAQVASVVAAVA